METENLVKAFLQGKNISFESINVDSKQIRKAWISAFSNGEKAPHMEDFLWHFFSFEVVPHFKGKAAIKELKEQWPSDILIFNEKFDFVFYCQKCLPILELSVSQDDIYICHKNMKWTYVVTHEIFSGLGPYFAHRQ